MDHDPEFHAPRPKVRSSPARWFIFLGLLLPFSLLSYQAVNSAPGDPNDRPATLAALATITGPFVGAIARHGQSCCLNFSLGVALFCGPVLALGLSAQGIPLPFRRGEQAVRLVFWTLGWFVWLAGAPVSFLHALF